jgi:phosphate starvation-inducible membrane PsiE
MIVFTCSYVAIINFVNQYLWDPKVYSTVFGLSESTLDSVMPTLSGLTQVLLFSICPVIFKFLANVEGSSSSMEEAEQRALIYFWYFYFIARFMGQLIWESVVSFTQRGKYE